jgi:hypothetical protein
MARKKEGEEGVHGGTVKVRVLQAHSHNGHQVRHGQVLLTTVDLAETHANLGNVDALPEAVQSAESDGYEFFDATLDAAAPVEGPPAHRGHRTDLGEESRHSKTTE